MSNKNKKHTSHSTVSSKKHEHRASASTYGDLNKHPSMPSDDSDIPTGAGKPEESSSTRKSACPIEISLVFCLKQLGEARADACKTRNKLRSFQTHISWLGLAILIMQTLILAGISYALCQ